MNTPDPYSFARAWVEAYPGSIRSTCGSTVAK
ncbi:hypothetical protein BH09ACT8_BH09ACT8_41800 [soil metagenome]